MTVEALAVGSEAGVARFWANVRRTDGCWEWTTNIAPHGYGRWGVSKTRSAYAHRVSWVLHYGPIPRGFLVCHHCDNRRCVRPDHLFLGTNAENLADMAAKGRSTQGERHPQVKLTADQVRAIRSAPGPQTEIASRYGVSQPLVSMIRSGRVWGHLA